MILTKKAQFMKTFFIFLLIFSHSLIAKDKHLILAEGNGWFPHMAENLIANHETISKLPFSGFIVVGNSFTDLVMKKNKKLTYAQVWAELKGLKGLYKNKTHMYELILVIYARSQNIFAIFKSIWPGLKMIALPMFH